MKAILPASKIFIFPCNIINSQTDVRLGWTLPPFLIFDLLQKRQLSHFVGSSKCESDVKAILSRFV